MATAREEQPASVQLRALGYPEDRPRYFLEVASRMADQADWTTAEEALRRARAAIAAGAGSADTGRAVDLLVLETRVALGRPDPGAARASVTRLVEAEGFGLYKADLARWISGSPVAEEVRAELGALIGTSASLPAAQPAFLPPIPDESPFRHGRFGSSLAELMQGPDLFRAEPLPPPTMPTSERCDADAVELATREPRAGSEGMYRLPPLDTPSVVEPAKDSAGVPGSDAVAASEEARQAARTGPVKAEALRPSVEGFRMNVPAGETDVERVLVQYVAGRVEGMLDGDAGRVFELATSMLDMGRYREAAQMFERLQGVPQYQVAATEGVIEVFVRLGRHEVAVQAATMALRFLRSEPGERIGVLYWQGRAMEGLGDISAAAAVYREVLSIEPAHGEAQDRLRMIGA